MNIVANASDLIALVNAGAVVNLSHTQKIGITFYHIVDSDEGQHYASTEVVRIARRTITSGRTMLVAPIGETPRWVLASPKHPLAADELAARYVNRPNVTVCAPEHGMEVQNG